MTGPLKTRTSPSEPRPPSPTLPAGGTPHRSGVGRGRAPEGVGGGRGVGPADFESRHSRAAADKTGMPAGLPQGNASAGLMRSLHMEA
jgi:hypothetical protein